MTKILFIRQPHVYLPEIAAYKAYLAKNHPNAKTYESTDLDQYNPKDFDVLWHFMGIDRASKVQGAYLVHEYNSLSTPPFAKIKNIVKRTINAKADQRIFLNQHVKDAFGFKDHVPAFLRDMGVDDLFFEAAKNRGSAFDYDFIYAGGLDRGAIVTQTLDHIAHKMPQETVLLVGDAPDTLKQRYAKAPNIIFHGRAPYQDIPKLLSRARYGLNFMPDTYPFNIQTATKVLEYAAANMPVISTEYSWIKAFEQQRGAQYFKLSPALDNLTKTALSDFDFQLPDVGNLRWDSVIEESGIFAFLK